MSKGKKSKAKKKKSTQIKTSGPMDLASFEGSLSDIFGDSDEETPLGKAQDMMYDAWEVSDPKQRIALARKALEISPDCADASTHHRNWCTYCPAGTMGNWLGRGKYPLTITSKCKECKKCDTVCPIQIKRWQYRPEKSGTAVVPEWDCLKF